jgi:hypothetical protein
MTSKECLAEIALLKARIKELEHEKFKADLREAAAEVATWPLWKQRWLEDSSKPTCAPRPFVDNSKCLNDCY